MVWDSGPIGENMNYEQLTIEFLEYYHISGKVSVSEMMDKLYMSPNNKFYKFKNKKFLEKMLDILASKEIITAKKSIRTKYFVDKVYLIGDDLE